MRTLRRELFRFRRNKSELIVLTGAIYSFVAYLTAFTLEVLFLVDLVRRSGDLSADEATAAGPHSSALHSHLNHAAAAGHPQTTNFDRLTLESSAQAHLTVSCLAVSILYFVIFVTSLILIVALIVNSTFMLLIWMCAMATLYLPEVGLVAYVAGYCWGVDSRNGRVELGFFLVRAILNLTFIIRAHKLYKQWNYEKNFFRLKSGGRTSAVSSHFAGYDSPYFIGDSLTTTINPVFSSSTLNLSRYDYVTRDFHPNAASCHQQSSSRGTSPTTNNSLYTTSSDLGAQLNSPLDSAHPALATGRGAREQPPKARFNADQLHGRPQLTHAKLGRFYLGETQAYPGQNSPVERHYDDRQLQVDYENDQLDYNRALANPQHKHISAAHHRHQEQHQHLQRPSNYNEMIMRHNQPTKMYNYALGQSSKASPAISRSQDNLASYSTQSLDRRHIRDFGLTNEQVVLRPLGHQPFEYLQRPGSTNHLNAVGTNPNAAYNTHHRDHYYEH